jgi:hypothetical protein
VEGPNPEAYYALKNTLDEAAAAAGRDPADIKVTLTGTTRRGPADLCAELGADRCVILPPGGDLDGKLPMRLERFAKEVIEPLS